MKILAIESATKILSVALVCDNKIIATRTSDNKKTHSETLLPMMEEMLDSCGAKLSEVDAIAVSNGPGSFTGLRIGVTTAKGLGLALDKPLIPVPTLEAMAYNFVRADAAEKLICQANETDNPCGAAVPNFAAEGALIVPMIDARRNQVFTGVYRFEKPETLASGAADKNGAKALASGVAGRELKTIMAEAALDVRELVDDLAGLGARKIIFLGDGALLHRGVLEEALGSVQETGGGARETSSVQMAARLELIFATGELAHPRATSVALLAGVMAERGEAVSADLVTPTYLRQSQAEREYTRVTSIGKKIISTTLDADNEGKVFEAEDEGADIDAIAQIEQAVFEENAWSNASVQSHFTNPCNGALVARRKGEAVGFVLFQKVAGEGEVFRIAVLPEYRRCGIARRLLSVLMQDGETDKWMLEVRYGNKPAIALYEAAGFERERVIQDYYKDPVEDALDMRKVIKEVE